MILPHANDLNNRLVTSDLYGDITVRALLKKTGFDPDDVNKYTSYGDTAMHYICFEEGNLTMVQISVACGADCRALDLPILAWAQAAVAHHDQLAASIASSLVNFNGQSVILERIGEYAGKLTPNGLRSVRELVVILPVYIKDTPFATMKENNPYEDLEGIESEEDDTEDYDY